MKLNEEFPKVEELERFLSRRVISIFGMPLRRGTAYNKAVFKIANRVEMNMKTNKTLSEFY